MPVPTWDCAELGLLEEPLETTTVVSEDIWKKFDLDFPQPFTTEQYYGTTEGATLPEPYEKTSMSRLEAREIRHHDCMWAGLCISKEHNRTHPAKKDVQMSSKKVPAGRSLLINRKPPVCTAVKNLESDGDSTRPETPQSCESESDEEDEEQEEEQEPPQFRHDSISINEKLTEYLGDAAAAPVSEVTGQLVRRIAIPGKKCDRRVRETGRRTEVHQEPKKTASNTPPGVGHNAEGLAHRESLVSLGDHCYYLSQTSSSKKLEHLGVQTPSDSEEEIDVVTFDKPCRPASLPTNPSAADKQHLQKTVTSALKDKSPPRPRGRPPSNPPRKRSAQTESRPAKRPRHKSYQKRGKPGSGSNSSSSSSSSSGSSKSMQVDRFENCDRIGDTIDGAKNVAEVNEHHHMRFSERVGGGSGKSQASSSTVSRSSSDDEPDTEKRSLHNNMERQRRIELRNAFEDLRVLVPEVQMKEKAPKVVILRQAAVYCNKLTETDRTNTDAVSDLKSRQDRLRSKLSQLRRNFAACR
ncbi:myc protein [Neodiprion lecontei]|uniref:Myc protein n=1 Tax=Neodiprion lecontei TaxID=441921 RepID=A0ABM3FGR0_NEOLC|nr:myc protein [Neodiprion lecontei]